MKTGVKYKKVKKIIYSIASSVSATPPVIEIYFLIGNDSTPRELSPLFPHFCSPLGGSRKHFPSLLASGPSTIHPHLGFHALCCSSGHPSTPTASRCCFSP